MMIEQTFHNDDNIPASDISISPQPTILHPTIPNHSADIEENIDQCSKHAPLVCGSDVSGPHNASGQVNDPDTSDQSVNNSFDNTVEINCSGCDESVGKQEWVKCTVCSDYDICEECFETGVHKHHRGYLQTFMAPPNPADGYCNSCGLQFHPEKTWFNVYHCAECEDYALCLKCRGLGRHYHHIQYMSKIKLGEYLAIVK